MTQRRAISELNLHSLPLTALHLPNYTPNEWAGLVPLVDWDMARAVTSSVVTFDGTLVTNVVDSVPDQSGNGRALTGGDVFAPHFVSDYPNVYKPSKVTSSASFNGKDTISFADTTHLTGKFARANFGDLGITNNGPVTMALVCKVNTRHTTSNSWAFQLEDQQLGVYSPGSSNGAGVWRSVASADFSEIVSAASCTVTSIIIVTLSGGTHRLYVNSTTEEGNHASTGVDFSVHSGTYTLGPTSVDYSYAGVVGNVGGPNLAGSGFTLNGEIARIIIWGSLLSSGEISAALGALGVEYGPTVSGGVPDAGQPWLGSSSLGASGSNGMTAVGDGVTTGKVLNERLPAHLFSTLSSYALLDFDGTLDTYASATAWSGWLVVDPTDASIQIFRTSIGLVRLHYTTGTYSIGPVVQFQAIDSANLTFVAERPFTIGAGSTHLPHIITFRISGGLIQVGVNEIPGAAGGHASAAFGTGTIKATALADGLHLGATLATGMTGDVYEIGMSDTALSDVTFTQIITKARRVYAQAFLP